MTYSEIELERYALNELPLERAARIREALATDAALRDRVAALSAGESDVRGWLGAGTRARLDAQPPAAAPRLLWAMAAAAVILLAAVVARPLTWPAEPAAADRVKGSAASLIIYRQTPGGSEQLEAGSVAHAGDVIRIGYRVSDTAYGTILSVDARGVVTVHLPANAGTAPALASGERTLLGDAYELDDAPQWERFFIVTGTTPFLIDPVVAAARGGAARLDLPPELTQSTFLLRKDPRP